MRVEQGGAYADLIFGSSLASFQHAAQAREQMASSAAPPPAAGGRQFQGQSQGRAAEGGASDDDLGAYVERTLGFWPGSMDSRARRRVSATTVLSEQKNQHYHRTLPQQVVLERIMRRGLP